MQQPPYPDYNDPYSQSEQGHGKMQQPPYPEYDDMYGSSAHGHIAPPAPAAAVNSNEPLNYPYPHDQRPSSITDMQQPDASPPKRTIGMRMKAVIPATKEMFQSKWPRTFLCLVLIQAIICIAFEAYVFAQFNSSLVDHVDERYDKNTEIESQLLTIPTFLSLFIIGFLYECWLAWDALRAKNTIQVIGLVASNAAILVYTAIQIGDIHRAFNLLLDQDVFIVGRRDIWLEVEPILIAIPCIIAFFTIVLGWVAWKLYQDYAWDILKLIGADYRMKKRFLHYQLYIALLKFDFFFFIGFTVQFLVVVGKKGTLETVLTALAIPVTVVILLCAAWTTRREWKPGMFIVMILYLGALAYFIFKLSRIYNPYWGPYYEAVQKSLTAFAVLTIFLILLTITNAIICTLNFGKGLKQHINAPRIEMDKDQVSYSLNDVKAPQPPSRMTID